MRNVTVAGGGEARSRVPFSSNDDLFDEPDAESFTLNITKIAKAASRRRAHREDHGWRDTTFGADRQRDRHASVTEGNPVAATLRR